MPFRTLRHSAEIQTRIEEHTLDLLEQPAVLAARRTGERRLSDAFSIADPASRARLPEIATEIALNALVGLADGYTGEDLPRLIMRTPRMLGGRAVPGNRGLHDNPDTFYRLIPLDGRSDFVLTGEASASPATIFELSALTEKWHTLGNLTKEDLGIAPHSRFRLRFGPKGTPEQVVESDATVRVPAGSRIEHFVQSTPDAEMLLVRETLADWARERPSRLSIENHVDRGGPRDGDDAARVALAAARVEKWFSEAIRLTVAPFAQPANRFPQPVISGEHGKLVTMAYSIGHFHVRPGEALVLRIDPGTARYVGVPITNLWGTTNENLARSASCNSHQAVYDADGRFTCVLSLEDPGVHNWLDPDGLERGFLFLRWAGLDLSSGGGRRPAIEAELVEIADLRRHLPPETGSIDASERARIESERERDHARRFEAFDARGARD